MAEYIIEEGTGLFPDGMIVNKRGDNDVTSLIISKSVTTINTEPLYKLRYLDKIVVSGENAVFDSRCNCNAIIETASNTLIKGCHNTIIPDSIKTVGNEAFFCCSQIKKIKIPDSVTVIGEFAFSSCRELLEINIPDSVTSIGMGAFHHCYSLSRIVLPRNLTEIRHGLFTRCKSLTSIVIPESVKLIDLDAFRWCENLNEVHLLGSETTFYENPFKGCINLKHIYVPIDVVDIYRENVDPSLQTLIEQFEQ